MNAQPALCADPAADVPRPVARPAFALWLWERGITYREAGRALGVSHAAVNNWCRPFSDPLFNPPKPAQAERVRAYTSGLVTPESFNLPDRERAQ